MSTTPPTPPDPYAGEKLPCDIVMKGGITSGIVYPSAVCEIAKTYRFKNVGGTSAGAIAAATTAAAEHGRSVGRGGYATLAQLPGWLSDGTNLQDLFQPGPRTKPLFALGMSVLGQMSPLTKAMRAIVAMIGGYWPWFLLGIVIEAAVAVLAREFDHADAAQWIVGVLLDLLLLAIVGAWRVWADVKGPLTENGFGLCNGLDKTLPTAQPLTAWLTGKLDELAGIDGDPLTFGDLWAPKQDETQRSVLQPQTQPPLDPDSNASDDAPLIGQEQREINFRMVTSCVTLGHPFGLPFETSRFYFRVADLERYFPPPVVTLMTRRAAQPRSLWKKIVERYVPAEYLPFPDAADVPVVVGARMSLSFPILLSAVPLYAIDWSLPANQSADTAIRSLVTKYGRSALDHVDELGTLSIAPDACWFTDGGISSNFPIQFFDSPLPKWPTFGIDLDGFQPGEKPSTNQSDNVWMADTNDGGRADTWNRFAQDDRRVRLGAFFAAIVDTMQNWVNNAQARTPGYRDRIAHVKLSDTEGGLNLAMPEPVRQALTARGAAAGALAVAHFKPGSTVQTNWDNHRWVRYRSFLGMAQWLVGKFHEGLTTGTPSYASLKASPPSYPIEPAQQTTATALDKHLDDAGVDSQTPPAADLEGGAPLPCPDLVVRPSL